MVRIQNMRPLAFKLIPWEFFEKLIILSKMDENNFFEKCVLELCRTAMIKPRQIERSCFFSTGLQLTNLNLQTSLRSIGCSVVENRDFSDRGWCLRPPPALTRVKQARPVWREFLIIVSAGGPVSFSAKVPVYKIHANPIIFPGTNRPTKRNEYINNILNLIAALISMKYILYIKAKTPS